MKLIDNIMYRFGYIPKRRMEGLMLIANEKKFELKKFRYDKTISLYELERTQMPLERHILFADEEAKDRMGRFLLNVANKTISDIQEHAMYRVSYEVWLAIRIK